MTESFSNNVPVAGLVSVYMPTQNRLELLKRAVDSVLCQTYSQVELIVIDDASTDGTAGYLEEHSKRDPRLIFRSNKAPRGAPASRNMAIRMANGEFVTGLDDDDEFLPWRVSAFVGGWNLLSAHGVKPALLYSQQICDIKGRRRWHTNYRGMVGSSDLYAGNDIGNQVFAPKAHFIEAGLFDEAMPAWQDLELFMRILRRFGTAHLVDLPSYIFDVSPRADRISVKASRVRKAFELIAMKNRDATGRQLQSLYLQIFTDYYGVRPNFNDWIKFLRYGFWLGGIRRMMWANMFVGRR